MRIPLVDLNAQYENIKLEIDNAIKEVINSSDFIGNRNNRFLQTFEKNFSDYLNVNSCIGCGNGTDAIEIVLKALGIGVNDEVILPAMSWISTSEAISSVGAKPVFVDINSDVYTINVQNIKEKINKNTKAIIPVHLYGYPADMTYINEIANQYNLFVIEDCAQAHGATYMERKVGTIGNAGTFSFFPAKNLGAFGDAGCIVTNDIELGEKCRLIANHGQIERHNHILEGRNSRLDGLNAAVLNIKLKYLDKWVKSRRLNADYYKSKLLDKNLVLPKERNNYFHAYHLFVIQTEERDKIKHILDSNGVDTSIHYPTPLPFLKAYESLSYKNNDIPVATRVTNNILSLPMYPELTKDNIDFICSLIK